MRHNDIHVYIFGTLILTPQESCFEFLACLPFTHMTGSSGSPPNEIALRCPSYAEEVLAGLPPFDYQSVGSEYSHSLYFRIEKRVLWSPDQNSF